MKVGKICSSCREGFVGKSCPRCGSPDARRAAERNVREPWRLLYELDEYDLARLQVMQRDGFRCRIIERGARCPAKTSLTVDHGRALKQLWRDAGLPMGVHDADWKTEYRDEWREFVRKASRTADLVTVCRSHHSRIEAARRDEERLDARLASRRR